MRSGERAAPLKQVVRSIVVCGGESWPGAMYQGAPLPEGTERPEGAKGQPAEVRIGGSSDFWREDV